MKVLTKFLEQIKYNGNLITLTHTTSGVPLLQVSPINPTPHPYLRVTWIRTLLYPESRGRR